MKLQGAKSNLKNIWNTEKIHDDCLGDIIIPIQKKVTQHYSATIEELHCSAAPKRCQHQSYIQKRLKPSPRICTTQSWQKWYFKNEKTKIRVCRRHSVNKEAKKDSASHSKGNWDRRQKNQTCVIKTDKPK